MAPKQLTAARKKLGLTPTEMARAMGVSYDTFKDVLREGFTCRRCGGLRGRVQKNHLKVCPDCTDGNARMTRPHSPEEQVRRARENGRLLMTWGAVL